MNFSALLSKMVIFVVLIAVGYFMARKGLLSPEFSKSASKLLLNVFIVCSIINSVIGSRPEMSPAEFRKAMFIIILSMVLWFALGFIFSCFYSKEKNAPQIELLMSSVNTLFVGLPVAAALCGSEAVFYIGLSCVPFNICVFSYLIWRLKRKEGDGKIRIKDMLTPTFAASVLSLLIFVTNPKLPLVVTDFFSTVSGATVPFSMIVIGATLGPISFADAFKGKFTWVFCVTRLIVVPLLVWLIVRNFTDNTILLVCCTVLAGCPSGVMCTPLSIQHGYSAEFSSRIIMVSTILSMVSLPLLCYVLF